MRLNVCYVLNSRAKGDIAGGPSRVTFGLMRCSTASLFDDLISAGEQRVRHVDPQRLAVLRSTTNSNFVG